MSLKKKNVAQTKSEMSLKKKKCCLKKKNEMSLKKKNVAQKTKCHSNKK